MKTLQFKWYYAIITMLFLSFTFVSCDDDDNDNPPMEEEMPKENPPADATTIVDIAVSVDDFSTLVAALQKAELVEVLNGKDMYTVFAPTNEAFNMLLSDIGASSLDDVSKEALTEILLYHVVPGKVTSSQIETSYVSSASPKMDGYNYSIYVTKDEYGVMLNSMAKVTTPDVMADNGVIHIIDKVITPQSITGHAIANAGLSNLTAAVVKAELADVLDDDANNFTVFAPTDDAFVMLLDDLGATLDDLSKEALTPILLYHVVNAFVPAADVSTGYVNTLSMGQDKYLSAYIDASSGVMINNYAKVVLTDVVATNGIIHVIDKVIMPNDVVDFAINNSNFSTLVEAVVKAELVETLQGDGPFTIFAPTNQAFNDLFNALEGVNGIADLSKEALTPILLAHVVEGNVQSGDLSNTTVPTFNSGKSLMISIVGGVTIDSDISVVLADVQGTNGVIHAIDKVIVP